MAFENGETTCGPMVRFGGPSPAGVAPKARPMRAKLTEAELGKAMLKEAKAVRRRARGNVEHGAGKPKGFRAEWPREGTLAARAVDFIRAATSPVTVDDVASHCGTEPQNIRHALYKWMYAGLIQQGPRMPYDGRKPGLGTWERADGT